MASPIELYIRQAAAARGIDPDYAVRVARSEGGLNDPTRQSLVTNGGRREPSYGPFQLLIGGGGSGFPEGMGNRALAAGIDPRDPNQWQRGVDFALDQAKKDGWRQWYGARAAGIDRWEGIGGPGVAVGGPGGDTIGKAPIQQPPPFLSGIGSPNIYPTGGDQIPGSLSAGSNVSVRPPGYDPSAAAAGVESVMGGKKKLTMGDRIAAAFEAAAKISDGPSHGGGGGFPGGPSPGQLEALPNILKMMMRPRVG